MAEKSLWAYLKKGMTGKWEHATRHENLVAIGTADVSYYLKGNGWIELKNVDELPVRCSTGVKLGQWHKNGGAQRYFLIKRHGWLFLRIMHPCREYMLFGYWDLPPWQKAVAWTYDDLYDHADKVWTHRIDFTMLKIILQDHQ